MCVFVCMYVYYVWQKSMRETIFFKSCNLKCVLIFETNCRSKT